MNDSSPSDAASIRLAVEGDRAPMLELWERAVRATHHFLDDARITALRPAVVDVLASDALQWWVIETPDGVVGFLGLVSNSVEALFIDPAHHGRGIGRLLMDHAQQLNVGSALLVDVNEENDGALAFYRRLGFEVVGRSATDADGRPYPLLHMQRAPLSS
jgi:putative acetyltransferase